MRAATIMILSSLICCACSAGGSKGNNSSAAAQSSSPNAGPTPEEMTAATVAAFDGTRRVSGQGVIYTPLGAVSNCVDGLDSAGKSVRSCDVCAISLSHIPNPSGTFQNDRGWKVERAIYSVPLRRALSHAQPDITPMGNDGVWVLNERSRVGIAPQQEYVLTREDYEAIGFEWDPIGFNQLFYVNEEGERSRTTLASIPLDVIQSPRIREFALSKVRACN